MLASDQSGFLTGVTVSDIKRSANSLDSIESNVLAIKKAVVKPVNSRSSGVVAVPSSRASNANNFSRQKSPVIATPGQRMRDSNGRFVSSGGAASNDDGGRDNKGRFTSNSGSNGGASLSLGLNGLGNKISTAILASGEGLEDVDPNVKAFQEVAQPLARGYQSLSGGGKGADRWYRKIFNILKLSKKEDTVYQKATKKSLKEIEGNEGGGGSSGGGFGIKASSIGSTIARVISRIVPLAITAIGSVVGVIFSPIGLAFGAAATLAWGMFTENGREFFGDIASSIAAKWDSAVDWFIEKFPDFSNLLGSGADSVKSGIDNAKGFLGGVMDAIGLATTSSMSKPDSTKTAKGKPTDNKTALIKQMRASGITNPKEQAMFLAQMDHESGGFKRLEENLNYKNPGRLMQISKTARGKGRGAVNAAVKQGPEAIAELLYGGRKDLGNTEKGDGYRFRGRGFTQLTGRANYSQASNDLGLDLVNNPDLASSPETAAKIATWFHKKNKGLVNASRNGDVTKARKLVNGGTNGLADVSGKYNQYLAQTSNNSLPTQTVSAPLPNLPAIARSQPVSDSPPVVTPLGSSAERKSLSVTVAKGDVTQDLGDRKIAHIVTGGMSA